MKRSVGIPAGLVACVAALGVVFPGARPRHPRPPAGEVVAPVPGPHSPDALKLAIDARSAEKDRLVGRVTAGQVTLAEAVRTYLALNRGWPVIPETSYDGFFGRTLGERIADLITDGVEFRLRDDPRRDAILARLACERAALAGLEPGWEWSDPTADRTTVEGLIPVPTPSPQSARRR